MPRFLTGVIVIVVVCAGVFAYLANSRPLPERGDIVYGATFSVLRAKELRLEWRDVYDALVDDLGIRHFRLVAHWPMVEPEDGVFNFTELDYQMRRAEEVGASVILAVGRRLPSWPECHVPEWTRGLSEEVREAKLFEYVEAVVERYKDSTALRWWQVENEPYIIGFAYENCGDIDSEFLEREIAFVQTLDPEHPVFLTASGELGFWNNTWSRAQSFGTTLYRHVYNADLKSFITYPTTPEFFRAKRAFTELTVPNPDIPAVISELAAEPWPVRAIVDTPVAEQLEHMSIPRFEATLAFAAKTGFTEQYLWGAEWWYYLKKIHGDDSFWEYARELF